MTAVKWQMRGQYMKNCNCVSSCPCDTTGFPYPGKGCEGMAGMHIIEGNFGKYVVLSGTGAVKFQYRNTHSSLAEVEHTQKGLRA